MVVMTCQCWVINLSHLWMVGQEVNNLQCILHVTLYTQTQCLNTLQQDKGIEWRQSCTGVAQNNGTDTGDVSGSTYCIGKYDTMVRWIGLSQCGEFFGISLPVELTTIYNHTTQ